MNLKRPLLIKVLYNTELTSQFAELDIPIPITDYAQKEIVLLSIDSIQPNSSLNDESTIICSGNRDYRVLMTFNETVRLIEHYL